MKIDVIIPYYNTSAEYLSRCLHSIAMQSINKDLIVTIVDDASTYKGYEEVIPAFENDLVINVYRYEENKGPGYARQYGLDRTGCPRVVFIDADDVFSSYIALDTMSHYMKPTDDICFGKIQEVGIQNNEYVLLDKDILNFTWMFAKMFNRDSIERSGATFNEGECSYANEDVGFNMQFLMGLGMNTFKYTSVDFVVYYWNALNFETITRRDDFEYTYHDGLIGYINNYIASYEKIKDKAAKDDIIYYCCSCMINIIDTFVEYSNTMKAKDCYDSNLQAAKKAYNEVFSKSYATKDNFIKEASNRENKDKLIKWYDIISQ